MEYTNLWFIILFCIHGYTIYYKILLVVLIASAHMFAVKELEAVKNYINQNGNLVINMIPYI